MNKLFNQDYSLVHPEVLNEQDRGYRVANQICQVLKGFQPDDFLSRAICLDIGSSSGSIDQHFIKYVQEIYGLDTDKNAIEIGERNVHDSQRLHFYTFDGEAIPFAGETFDLVIFRRVYSCCPLEIRKRLISEIYRVLKPGGLCYFEGHNLLSVLEPDYQIPFLHLLPLSWTKRCLFWLGHKDYYLGRYQTFWGLKKLFKFFSINIITYKVLKYPKEYGFTLLQRYSLATCFIPLWLMRLFEPFTPVFIWILQKPSLPWGSVGGLHSVNELAGQP